MKEIKRYNVVTSNFSDYFISESPQGDFVYYQHHEAIVKELQAKINELELKLAEINNQEHINSLIELQEIIQKNLDAFGEVKVNLPPIFEEE